MWIYVTSLLLFSILDPEIVESHESRGSATANKSVLSGSFIGDIVPSTYPVFKINQSVNNDSTFANLRKEELEEIRYQALKLMSQQREVFERLRQTNRDQTRRFEGLALGSQRQ
ncbi:signal peptide-containing protein [Theileria equi strain WA]|uniref:Signal peptide-containing protein n=1 Tax=Theileria equi strain WA TaxID=1537102 RepID=L0AZK1_THEEQ|nr:signal peptide-containing protein [Theileria equi strain WA]AFZ80324.1 signal peptide-containing protein [Theileria equi strain WA]|eukprot:XP_004829990.1 signal peptide-containing protein [Theileria equi strain WA]